jgi:3-dehydroquinate dehydratase/shikimate dehydrogenase
MQSEPAASVIKVAYAARSIRDNLELFDMLEEGAGGRPMIALGVGRFGLMSRVLAPKFGGFLTFASLHEAAATAPGQPTVRDLLDVYRFESMTPHTRVYAIIGWPVEHSLGPLVHNAGFESLAPEADADSGAGFDGVYIPMPVPPEWEHFKATLMALIDHPRLDFHGCSVTVPHKQHLVRFAREALALTDDDIEWSLDDLSDICGAANTLVVERDAAGSALRARVMNTDAPAAAACLQGVIGDLSGKRIVLVGAGGVSRAIAAGLLAVGARVVVVNRNRGNADKLVTELNAARKGRLDAGELVAADQESLGRTPCDAIVNCTPVGMNGGPDPNRSPVSVEQLRECSAGGPPPVVFDTVYNPLRTPLLKQASLAGHRTIDGVGMFVRQAAEQFAAWTGHPAPAALFEEIAREALEERMGG